MAVKTMEWSPWYFAKPQRLIMINIWWNSARSNNLYTIVLLCSILRYYVKSKLSNILAVPLLCLTPLYIRQDGWHVHVSPSQLALIAGLQLLDHRVVQGRHSSQVHGARGLAEYKKTFWLADWPPSSPFSVSSQCLLVFERDLWSCLYPAPSCLKTGEVRRW